MGRDAAHRLDLDYHNTRYRRYRRTFLLVYSVATNGGTPSPITTDLEQRLAEWNAFTFGLDARRSSAGGFEVRLEPRSNAQRGSATTEKGFSKLCIGSAVPFATALLFR